MAKTYGASRWRRARRRSRACYAPAGQGYGSSNTSSTAAMSSTATPAGSAARASCRSAWARRMSAAALAQVQEPGGAGGEARGGRGVGEAEVEMSNEKPWRIADLLADLTFVPLDNGMERATINGVQIVRQNGRYWIMTHNRPQWSDIGEKDVNPALDYLFGDRKR